MKIINIIFISLLFFCNTAIADNWKVTWEPIKESIIDKEYGIAIQNLQGIKRDVNISSFFAETDFDISKLTDVKFYEWKTVSYNYTVNHYDEIEHTDYNEINDTWNNWTESVINYTETIESEKLDWKNCKAQLFKEDSISKENNYGFINIPAYGSKPKDDGTYNGTKLFKLTFKTPIIHTNTYGSSGKFALLLDDIEHHPYWNTSWSTRKEIILTGNTSGAQIDYQILLNISYQSGMQTDFDDLRFCNDTDEIDSWLESKVDGSYALIWVEFPTTPTNGINRTYYMYYGNDGAASDWDIAATFIAGYDFSSFSGWTGDTPKCTANQTYQGKTGCLKCNDDSSSASLDVKDDVVFPSAFIIECNIAQDVDYYSLVCAGNAGNSLRTGWAFRPSNISYYWDTSSYTTTSTNPAVDTWYKAKLVAKGGTGSVVDMYIDDVLKLSNKTLSSAPTFLRFVFVGGSVQGNAYYNDLRVRKYATNPPTYAFGGKSYYAGSIHYNNINSYNHTIDSNGEIIVNRSITTSDNIGWTAAALTDNCHLVVTKYDLSNLIITNFTIYTASLDWLTVTDLSTYTNYSLLFANGTLIESQNSNGGGVVHFTTNLLSGSYIIEKGEKIHPFSENAYQFYNEMESGLTDFRDDMGKYLVWGILFFAVGLAFTIFAKIKQTLIGGK